MVTYPFLYKVKLGSEYYFFMHLKVQEH